ncbi:MAG: hypothetical protein EZS28_010430 [Streblomastix strix]|uniref:Uncharacterized protein n=1 Tax=Streblomastix strix TaxID=222440 RepID=A0A5J4WGA8_9EUKA|nr:MAG: hypothetical protein EZS28_010430 [Streblomastix strix]
MHLHQLGTIETTLKINSVDAFRNDGEHHYSIKEIKPESLKPVLFDKEILIVLTAILQFDNKFEGYEESYKDGTVLFIGLKTASQLLGPMQQQERQKKLLKISNLDLLFEATDEFDYALSTPRNTASRRLNPHTDLTSFMITLQYERNNNGAQTFDGLDTNNQNVSVELRGAPIYQGKTDCYYNFNLLGKKPPPPILCIIHDTFCSFRSSNDGSCVFDVNIIFDELKSQIEC